MDDHRREEPVCGSDDESNEVEREPLKIDIGATVEAELPGVDSTRGPRNRG